MRVTVELPDHLVAEIEGHMPDITWSRLITDCLEYALAMADSEPHDGPQSPDHPTTNHAGDYSPDTTPATLNSHHPELEG
jgi:hypothetical protein